MCRRSLERRALMDTRVLERRFAEIGARVNVEGPPRGSPRIDVRTDRRGEYFDISFAGNGVDAEIAVVESRPADRHLLMLVRTGEEKSKFLCGFDERHYFVAAIPEEARGVTGVAAAKDALQPEPVREAIDRKRPKDRFRRRNSAYVRQGEWFFVPEPDLEVEEKEIVRNEPLSRGRGTPHVMELAYRSGGTTVYVNRQHPSGISEDRFGRLTDDQRRSGGWTRMVRDADVFAKGAIRHPDHATIDLAGWHRVLMNTEQHARAMQHVVFLD
jgi:hypothetical protein